MKELDEYRVMLLGERLIYTKRGHTTTNSRQNNLVTSKQEGKVSVYLFCFIVIIFSVWDQ